MTGRNFLGGKTCQLKSMDLIDREILSELREDARLSMRELGRRVSLSAPAVGERVRKLEERGVIERYTIAVNEPSPRVVAYIEVTMRSAVHEPFLAFFEREDELRECARVSGAGCYFLRAECGDLPALDALLERLRAHANYRVSVAVSIVRKNGGASDMRGLETSLRNGASG
jgi:Lrp/AsnC family leucine-responsive transcriptional regulator